MSELSVALFGPTLETAGANAGRACVMIEIGDAGTRLAPEEIVRELLRLDTIRTYRVAVTGSTAAEQWTDAFAVPIRRAGYRIHLESDGTHAPAGAVDWLSVAPRKATRFADVHPDEIRVVVDATSNVHELDDHAARWRCDHYLVQPRTRDDLSRCLQLVAARPRWRLSLELPRHPEAAIGPDLRPTA